VIELLKGFPDNVTAFACHDHVTKSDYETVVIPDFEDRLRRHKKVRPIVTSRLISTGSILARSGDTKFGVSHFFDWERGALVTDVEWIKQAVKFFSLFGFLTLREGRVFPFAEANKARAGGALGTPAMPVSGFDLLWSTAALHSCCRRCGAPRRTDHSLLLRDL
jgi:hypothetical protein